MAPPHDDNKSKAAEESLSASNRPISTVLIIIGNFFTSILYTYIFMLDPAIW